MFVSRLRDASAPLITAIAFFFLWEVSCRIFSVPDVVLPTPSQSVVALVSDWGIIWPNARHTLFSTCTGFAISVVFGILL